MATPAFSSGQSPLFEKIRNLIAEGGPISFHDYMQMALYDPELGYYASGTQRVGKKADFITSVSVGSCFGLILARRMVHYWKKTGMPDTFHIIEPGAHDGALCVDILAEIRAFCPAFYEVLHYHLIDTTPALIAAQEEKLGISHAGKFTSHRSMRDLTGLHGALISNELIDAFPVELIRYENGSWHQLFVGESDGTLHFLPGKCSDPALGAFLSTLGDHFPDGYTTEYNPHLTRFTREASSALCSGIFVTIDYGHHGEDYYHPGRTTGTLQTYHRHQKSENPLELPGEIDITSHVDFTRLTTAAESAGFTFRSLTTQASYLTKHAREWLMSLETSSTSDSRALLRQFQTLTHPAMLGTRFFVLEMEK